ncbi:MAG: peptidase S41 [Bacteroidales bacterium]|jgi:hypothetical protein|nr:peptidase S41 [Bacteroidales bacterium]
MTHQNIINYNFDFEDKPQETGIPNKWFSTKNSHFSIITDTLIKYHGNAAVKIEALEESNGFEAVMITVPAIYIGSTISLTGFLKLQAVEDAIGLMLRIDGKDKVLQFDNIMQKNIRGTIDWKQYTVSLPLPKDATQIVIGIILRGKGIVWADKIELFIDEQDFTKAAIIEAKNYPADNDTEFATNSTINVSNLTDYQISNLTVLGKIWGFLKYYHPNIAAGQYNWDYELFRILPKIIDSENNEQRDDILINWIKNLGKFKTIKSQRENCKSNFIHPDLAWIENTDFKIELHALLQKIEHAQRNGQHYYIALIPYVNNPIFKNENSYKSINYTDFGYRILSLFRYWNIINYYYPYKNIIGEDWNKILPEFIKKLTNINSETEYILTTLELIARIHDTHASIWANPVLDAFNGLNIAPILLSFVEDKAVVTGFFDDRFEQSTDLQRGDVITKINDKKIETLVVERLKYATAANYPTQLRDIAAELLRTNESTLSIEFQRDEKWLNIQVYTFPINSIDIPNLYQKKDTCFKFFDKKISYLYLGSVKNKYLPQLWKQIEMSNGLIIDLRCYPTDFTVFDLGTYLMPDNTPFVKFSQGSITCPGTFMYSDVLQVGRKNPSYYKGKIAILINELTQSSAEYTAMALRVAPNAKVFGSTTAGADGNVSFIMLPGGIQTAISGIGVYYPDGKETQRIGIVPDVEVKATIKGIKEGRDEVLEKAIEWIEKE